MMIEAPPLPFGNAAARWYYVLLKGLVARGHKDTAFGLRLPVGKGGRDRERPGLLFPGSGV